MCGCETANAHSKKNYNNEARRENSTHLFLRLEHQKALLGATTSSKISLKQSTQARNICWTNNDATSRSARSR